MIKNLNRHFSRKEYWNEQQIHLKCSRYARGHRPEILAFERYSQGEHEFRASLRYTVNSKSDPFTKIKYNKTKQTKRCYSIIIASL